VRPVSRTPARSSVTRSCGTSSRTTSPYGGGRSRSARLCGHGSPGSSVLSWWPFDPAAWACEGGAGKAVIRTPVRSGIWPKPRRTKGFSLVFSSTSTCVRSTPQAWARPSGRCTWRLPCWGRIVVPSTVSTRRTRPARHVGRCGAASRAASEPGSRLRQLFPTPPGAGVPGPFPFPVEHEVSRTP
jgi:hypothetical protein